jgi:hypothetical protein
MKFLIFLMSFLMVLTPDSFARVGGGISGGGDFYAAQFTKTGYDVLKALQKVPLAGVDNVKLKKALETVRVTSTLHVSLQGAEVDAINTPSAKTIRISRTRWNQLNASPKKQFILVAHEYFSVMGLNDLRYEISELLFNRAGIALYQYDCKLFQEASDTLQITLKVAIYKDFVNLAFTDNTGGLIDSEVEGFSTMNAGDMNPATYDVVNSNVLVTLNFGLMVQMISLPYSSDIHDPRFDMNTFTPISKYIGGIEKASDIQNAQVTCKLTKF